MKKTTLAIITVLLLLCMCLPVGFEQPPVVNDITSQTSARNDDTNQQPGENQTATDLCQDLPPEHETTEGVWICDPDGKLVDAEGNVIEWQWHGDELPITPVECDEKPTEKQLAGTIIASVLNKDYVILIQSYGEELESYDEELESYGEEVKGLNIKLEMLRIRIGSEERFGIIDFSKDTANMSDLPEDSEPQPQPEPHPQKRKTGVHVEYELRYVENATEENSVTNNISWEFIIFPERVEISSSGSNQDHGGGIVITVGNGGNAESDKLVEVEVLVGSDSNDTFAPVEGEPNEISSSGSNQDHGGGIVIMVGNGGIGVVLDWVLLEPSMDSAVFIPFSTAEEVDLEWMAEANNGVATATEMRFVFDAVEDNSTTDNQTLDGIEYELAEMNIIERKGCTLSVPELAPSFDDEDADGVIDAWDDCENTTAGVATDSKGCDVKAVIDANNTPGFTLIAVLTMSVGAAMLLGRQRIYD